MDCIERGTDCFEREAACFGRVAVCFGRGMDRFGRVTSRFGRAAAHFCRAASSFGRATSALEAGSLPNKKAVTESHFTDFPVTAPTYNLTNSRTIPCLQFIHLCILAVKRE